MRKLVFFICVVLTVGFTGLAHAADPNLVAHWKFDEGSGSTAFDAASNNDGNVYGANWTSGQINGALSFDGLNDYVQISDSPELSPPKITLAAWIYPNDVSHTFQIIGKWASGDPEYLFDNKNNNDALRLFGAFGGVGDVLKSNDAVLTADTWQHVAVTWDGSNGIFYVNGTDAGQDTSSGDLPDSDNPVTIGRRKDRSRYFNGKIDDVRIYNRALSAGEIWQICAEGFAGRAFNPEPADGAIRVSINRVLSWSAGAWVGDVNGHDVYFGTDYTEVNDATTNSAEYMGNQDTNSWATVNYEPCGLEYGTCYYWRVDEVNEADVNSPWKGDVWSFMSVFSDDALHVPQEYPTIQAAINAAVDGNVVVVAPGRYTGNGNRDIDFRGKAITVRSENGPESTIVDCQGGPGNEHRGFYFHSNETANSILDGFTITNGYGLYSPRGGAGNGLYCSYSSPTIKNCIITDGKSHEGIFCFGHNGTCNPTFINCIIANNKNGGIASRYDCNLTFINCIITGNKRGYGAGIYMYAGCDATLINCFLTGNKASSVGGGIYIRNGNLTLTNCTISDCSAGSGGGIYCYCTGKTIVANTILWGNTANSGAQIAQSVNIWCNGSTVTVSYSDVQGGKAAAYVGSGCKLRWYAGNIDIDPCFVQTGYWDINDVWIEGDYHLAGNSSCIDTGDPNFIPEPNETDLDGNPRVVDGDNDGNSVVDMGAYEWMPPTPAELIAELLEEVTELELPSGIENSLMAKLEAALGALEDENENNDAAAVNTLQAFINAVKAQRGKKIPEAEADVLIAAAQEIIDLLSDE